MIIRKWVKDTKLENDEEVVKGTKNVIVRDGAGNRNEIIIGIKYIVSGDWIKDFFEPVKKKKKPDLKEA